MCFHLNKLGWLSQLHRMLESHVGWRCISRKYIRIYVYSWLDEGGKYHSVVGVYFYELLTDLYPGPCLWESRVCTWPESIFLASTRTCFNWIIVEPVFLLAILRFNIWNSLVKSYRSFTFWSWPGLPDRQSRRPSPWNSKIQDLPFKKKIVCFSYSRLPPSGKS